MARVEFAYRMGSFVNQGFPFLSSCIQKEIARACHIEPATITSVLLGMENKGLITRKNLNGNRRSLYVYLTDKGKILAKRIETEFESIEDNALKGFTNEEKKMLTDFLIRVNPNMPNWAYHLFLQSLM